MRGRTVRWNRSADRAVAEERNFTRAAARCHVVQSALSYQVARLEREQNVTLFHRTSRVVQLAPAGELLLPTARSILRSVEHAQAELAAFAGVVIGRLRLGMIGSASRAVPAIDQALISFHAAHPGVEILMPDAGSRQMAEQILSGDLVLAFVGLFAGQLPGGVVHRVLSTEPLVAVVGQSHPLAARHRPVSLVELADAGAFIEMRSESGVRTQVDAAFDRAGVTRKIAFELATSQDVVRLAGLGFGIAVVPTSAAHASDVEILSLDDPDARHPISLIHSEPEPSAPSARAYLSLLLDRPPTRVFDRQTVVRRNDC
jgi:DNA-binding transcriptional LysR family regulator